MIITAGQDWFSDSRTPQSHLRHQHKPQAEKQKAFCEANVASSPIFEGQNKP